MAEEPKVSLKGYQNLKLIIGHSPDSCNDPDNDKVKEWLEKSLRPCIEQLKSSLERFESLQFIDLLFSRFNDKGFFGGFVIRSNIASEYKNGSNGVIDKMYSEHISVAAQKDFKNGFYTLEGDNHEEKWLFSWLLPGDSCSSEALTDHSDDSFEIVECDLKEDLKALPLNETPEQWLAQSIGTDKTDPAWQHYIQACNNIGINCLAGIPITIPQYSKGIINNKEPFLFVGSLFIGLRAIEKDNPLSSVGIIARHIIPLALRTYAMQAAKYYGEQREMEKSHRLLMHLQRPLDALMKAFDTVQSEAQEMNAILNDPEEGLFQAHKFIAHFFQEEKEIRVSDYLKIKASHNWENNSLKELQKGFCYLLCCIFGVEDKLKPAQSHESIVQYAWSALRDARHKAVYDDLIKLLEKITWQRIPTEYKDLAFEDFVLEQMKSDKDDSDRFQNAILALKYVCFSPFKDITGEWFNLPVYIAARGVDHDYRTVEDFSLAYKMPSSTSPFAQHSILNFIIGVESYLKNNTQNAKVRNIHNVIIENLAGSNQLHYYEISLIEKCMFYIDNPENARNLQDCLNASIRFGVNGLNLGNFLGVFQNLMRHSVGCVDINHAKQGDWVLFPPPTCAEGTNVLVFMGKLSSTRIEKMPWCNACAFIDSIERFFAISQHINAAGCCTIRVSWMEPTSIQDTLMCNFDQNVNVTKLDEKESFQDTQSNQSVAVSAAALVSLSELATVPINYNINIVVIDHDTNADWYTAITKIGYTNVTDLSEFNRNPDGLLNDNRIDGAVVVLHNYANQADSWVNVLKDKAGKVIVVSTEGNDLTRKNITESDKFVLFMNQEYVPFKPDDLIYTPEIQEIFNDICCA